MFFCLYVFTFLGDCETDLKRSTSAVDFLEKLVLVCCFISRLWRRHSTKTIHKKAAHVMRTLSVRDFWHKPVG